MTLTKISDLKSGTAMATRPDDAALYLAQQSGQITALENGQSRPVLDLSGRLVNNAEHGLLGLAFSPDGSKLYVHFSAAGSGDTTLEEYAFTNGQADVASRRLVFTAPDLQYNHNGGDLTFGPDGNLYLALGDGGGANDEGSGHAPEGNGQSLTTVLGKIIRIDPRPTQAAQYRIPPDNPFATGGGSPEIWVYGLRNPWRFSFDRQTDDVWIADVGQNAYEEVNLVPFASAAGSNFGWPLQEGAHDFRGGAAAGSTVLPIHETTHADGNCAITGGYVYRGTRIPDLVGSYLYTDYCRPVIAAIQVLDGQVVVARDLGVSATQIASFGQDNGGELYVISQSEGVFRIDPA
ncbi:MAG: PQQ-dependent sugar dehydrogenase [Actinobacteria bacterium]|nr:PQQ-dependent sugar dehydrogenase [Actinomycetota bacterium]